MRKDRILGGMVGLLVGDAIGIPYETVPREKMPDLSRVDDLSIVPKGFERKHAKARPMTYSDDGSQALCLLASLLECGEFNAQDFGERLVRWFDDGYLAAGGGAFGTGGTTREALKRIRNGVPATQAGLTEETALGNGGLMRVLPLVLWHRGSDEELIELAKAQCRVTHAHLRAQVTVAAYCLWAKKILEAWTAFDQEPRTPRDHPWRGDHDHTYANVLTALLQMAGQRFKAAEPGVRTVDMGEIVSVYDLHPKNTSPEILEVCRLTGELGGYKNFKKFEPSGGFHVVDTFYSAVVANGVAAMNMAAERSCRGVSTEVMIADQENIQNEYENVLRVAIQFGQDTDTTAAVAGGIAGIRFGLKAIRPEWISAMMSNAHPGVTGLIEKLGVR